MKPIKIMLLKFAKNIYPGGIPLSTGFGGKKEPVFFVDGSPLFEIAYVSPNVEADGTITLTCVGIVSGEKFKTKGISSQNRIFGTLHQSTPGTVFVPDKEFLSSVNKDLNEYLLKFHRVTNPAARQNIIDRLMEDIVNNVPVRQIYEDIQHSDPAAFDNIVMRYRRAHQSNLVDDVDDLVKKQEYYKHGALDPLKGFSPEPAEDDDSDDDDDLDGYKDIGSGTGILEKKISRRDVVLKIAEVDRPEKGQKVRIDVKNNPFRDSPNGAAQYQQYDQMIDNAKKQFISKDINIEKNPVVIIDAPYDSKGNYEAFALNDKGVATKIVVNRLMMEKVDLRDYSGGEYSGTDEPGREADVDESLQPDEKELVSWLSKNGIGVYDTFSNKQKLNSAWVAMKNEKELVEYAQKNKTSIKDLFKNLDKLNVVLDSISAEKEEKEKKEDAAKEKTFIKAMQSFKINKNILTDVRAYVLAKKNIDKMLEWYDKNNMTEELPGAFLKQKNIVDSPGVFDHIFYKDINAAKLALDEKNYKNKQKVLDIYRDVLRMTRLSGLKAAPTQELKDKIKNFNTGANTKMINSLLKSNGVPKNVFTNRNIAIKYIKQINSINSQVQQNQIWTDEWNTFVKQTNAWNNQVAQSQPKQNKPKAKPNP